MQSYVQPTALSRSPGKAGQPAGAAISVQRWVFSLQRFQLFFYIDLSSCYGKMNPARSLQHLQYIAYL